MILVVLVLAAWGVLAVTQALNATRRASDAHEALRVRVMATNALALAEHPPDLPLLCLTGPLGAQRRSWPQADDGRVEIRWRHVGHGVILVEVDAIGATLAQVRLIAWMTPDSLARSGVGRRCAGARLRPLTHDAVVSRPGP